MTTRIIALTGLARSGKDTVGQHLVTRGFTRVALADELKKAALALDPLVPDVDPADPTITPSGYVRLSEYVFAFGWEDAKTNPEVRRTLQRLGTEAGWMFHGKDLWTQRVEGVMAESDGPFVITDLRMPHEAEWVRCLGGAIWRVERPGTGLAAAQGTHVSEAGGFDVDRVVVNDGTLEQLHEKVDALLDAPNPGRFFSQFQDWLTAREGRRVRVHRSERHLPDPTTETLVYGVIRGGEIVSSDSGDPIDLGLLWVYTAAPLNRVVRVLSEGGYRDRDKVDVTVKLLD